jgi:virginiamycin B lyase
MSRQRPLHIERHAHTGRRRSVVLVAIVLAASAGGCAGVSDPPVTSPPGSASTTASPAVASPDPATPSPTASVRMTFHEYAVPRGSHPHDVAPAADGGIWYTAQAAGELGWLDPGSGAIGTTPLGPGSAPHGVILGPDGAPWVTDSGLNAIVRVDPRTFEPTVYPLPEDRAGANLNTATFDGEGILWFTGQSGVYGRLDPASGDIEVFDAPRGRGPYGITATPAGDVWYASLAGSHIARIDGPTGRAEVVEPPTPDQGARRVWSDSHGRLWVAEWEAGQLGRYDPTTDDWREWQLPGDGAMAYAVYVDDRDIVWLTDFGANAIGRFDPTTETFSSFLLPTERAEIRQLHGRPGEVWGAESSADKIIVLREE